MPLRQVLLVAAAAACAQACEVPYAPKWNVDVFFPIRYPDVPLSQFGPTIPPFSITFTTPADSDAVSDATRQILDQDIDSLRADFIFQNATNVRDSITVSVSPNRAFLFSTNPAQAVTVTIQLRVTAGDTIRRTVNPALFKTAQTLYTQTRGSIRSGTGGLLPVGANDVFRLGVDLTANVRMSK
jgi:hypothetical protein